MEHRKVRDREDALELLDALDASGRSLSEYCRSRGIDGRSLNCWRRNLRRSRPAKEGLRLVEVAVSAPRQVARYRIAVDGIEIEVDDHFHDDTLARLLGVVLAC